MKDIRLTLVQMNSRAGDPEGNLERMAEFVEDNSDSDIICFPEMCLSGYTTDDPGRFALTPDDSFVLKVHELAENSGTAIVFGYLEIDGDSVCMRQEIADGSGTAKYYRKSHLGAMESKVFKAGDDLPVFDIKGVKTGLQLCIESHIQDISASLRSKGAELILMPFANGITGERRRSSWYTYLPARASDNGLFVACCSAIGDNGYGAQFGGGTIALDPKGNTIAEYYGTDPHSITLEIGGKLPRDGPETMSNISYYDRRRPELY